MVFGVLDQGGLAGGGGASSGNVSGLPDAISGLPDAPQKTCDSAETVDSTPTPGPNAESSSISFFQVWPICLSTLGFHQMTGFEQLGPWERVVWGLGDDWHLRSCSYLL